jgi:MFS family permease
VNGARGRWLALGVLCLSLLAMVIDNTIVNVALPTLVRDLDADVSELEWVVDAYTLAFAGLLLAGTLSRDSGMTLRPTMIAGAQSGTFTMKVDPANAPHTGCQGAGGMLGCPSARPRRPPHPSHGSGCSAA